MNKLLIVTPNDSIYNAAVNIISEADALQSVGFFFIPLSF